MSDNLKENFVNNLRRIMNERGVYQSDIVTALGVSSATASDWCNGKSFPRANKIQALADLLHCRYSDLTGYGDAGLPPLLSDQEYELIQRYRKLSPDGKRYIIQQFDAAEVLFPAKPADLQKEG